jgi:hypothetical protein
VGADLPGQSRECQGMRGLQKVRAKKEVYLN